MNTILFLVVIAILLAGAWMFLKQKENPENKIAADITTLLTRSDNNEGNVNVKVIYATPEYFQSQGTDILSYQSDKDTVFIISLDTHSVDLSSYAIDKITLLRDENGKEYPAIDWEPIDEGTHHRSGIIKFSKYDTNGNLIIKSNAKFIEIVVKDISGIKERVFRWNLPIKYN